MSQQTAVNPGPSIIVLMPLRDDWESASRLIPDLDRRFAPTQCELQVFLVDDGSLQDFRREQFQANYSVVRSIRTIRLRCRLGHQRAIAIGLVHIATHCACDAVLVMDADGEDTADGALQLLDNFTGDSAVFAARSRRTESLLFRCLYVAFKLLHRALTGISVRVGNFSILPARYLTTLIATSDLWNHYAAAVFRSGLLFTTTPIPRGRRIAGTSRMNVVSLTAHGISAISVFADVVGVRLLVLSLVACTLAVLGILSVIGIKLWTVYAIPGWATISIGVMVVILMQLVTMAASFTFTMLANRSNLNFVPLRDHAPYIADIREIYGRD